jgi:hypothetical protein
MALPSSLSPSSPPQVSPHLDLPVYLDTGWSLSQSQTRALSPWPAVHPGIAVKSIWGNSLICPLVWLFISELGGGTVSLHPKWHPIPYYSTLRWVVGGGQTGTSHTREWKSFCECPRPQDHLTRWCHLLPQRELHYERRGILPFHWLCLPIYPDPTETLQWPNIKQGFMEPGLIWTLKVCETCLGTKGRLSGSERAEGISFSAHRLPSVFLIDRPWPGLIEMTCSWRGAGRARRNGSAFQAGR